ncbi:MAG: XcyI family restriction endonuclease [Anaerolineae bacterium]
MATSSHLPVLEPDLQISFLYRLRQIESQFLATALRMAVAAVDIRLLDRDLSEYVAVEALTRVASWGLRGEVLFATPCVLRADPRLLGYYRLLLGFSQKEFYNRGPFGRFRCLEEGTVAARIDGALPALCASLAASMALLIGAVDELTPGDVRDLQLLTLGPQLRGSRNTRLGQDATEEVFALIQRIVARNTVDVTGRSLTLVNDSGRQVLVEFLSDPDVRIVELLPMGKRPLVSIEIKGGGDRSNVHNRLGEAEKSHQKARQRGFFEFWTIVRARVSLTQARAESPTTTHFFDLDAIADPLSTEHRHFRELMGSLIGMRVEE